MEENIALKAIKEVGNVFTGNVVLNMFTVLKSLKDIQVTEDNINEIINTLKGIGFKSFEEIDNWPYSSVGKMIKAGDEWFPQSFIGNYLDGDLFNISYAYYMMYDGGEYSWFTQWCRHAGL